MPVWFCTCVSDGWPLDPAAWLHGSNLSQLLLLVHVAVLIGFVVFGWAHISRHYRQRWYDLSQAGLNQPLQWPDATRLSKVDPTEIDDSLRGGSGWRLPYKRVLRDGVIAILVFWAWLVSLNISCVSIETLGDMKDYGFVLGIFAFILGVVKFVVETRIKTRSDNRQKWINEIRAVLAVLIQNIPVNADLGQIARNYGPKRSTSYDVFMENHIRLELLLNPVEKDHRTLLALLRYAYGFKDVPLDTGIFEKIDIKSDNDWKFDVSGNADDWREIKSRIVRLANAVLKREWEQVKHAR